MSKEEGRRATDQSSSAFFTPTCAKRYTMSHFCPLRSPSSAHDTPGSAPAAFCSVTASPGTLTMAALLKLLTPPPRPLICRPSHERESTASQRCGPSRSEEREGERGGGAAPSGSGEPMAARMMRSRTAGAYCASASARKRRPREVPPRQKAADTPKGGMAVMKTSKREHGSSERARTMGCSIELH